MERDTNVRAKRRTPRKLHLEPVAATSNKDTANMSCKTPTRTLTHHLC